jgi:hypothetical protein
LSFKTNPCRSAADTADEIERSTFLLMLRSDLNRALSKAFVLSVLGTTLCVLFGAAFDALAELMFLTKTWKRYMENMDISQKIPVQLLELLSLDT